MAVSMPHGLGDVWIACAKGPTKATVQDGGIHRVACVLYNRTELVTALEAIGYEVVDAWKAWELSLKLVGKPEYSALPYSGFFFRLKGLAPKRRGTSCG